MGYCNRCHSFSCSCGNHWNLDSCGVPEQINSKYVFYRGGSLSCIPVTTGQDLETIIKNIDTAICAIEAPSGLVVVEGTTGEIDVISSTVGDTTTYTISLDSDITDFISDTQGTLTSLQTCCDNSVKSITTDYPDTLDITDDGSGNYTLNVTAPSGSVVYDGIIYNNSSISPTNGLGGVQTLKSFNYNYGANSNIGLGDEIRFVVIGSVDPLGGIADTVTIDFVDATLAVTLASKTFNAFSNSVISTYRIQGEINLGESPFPSPAICMKLDSATTYMDSSSNIVYTDQLLYKPMIGGNSATFNNLTIRVRYNNLSGNNTGANGVYRLMIEVRKKI